MADVLVVTGENFEWEIVKADKPAMIDFWAAWCGPCRMMHPVVEGLAEEYEGRAVIARCDVDQNPALAAQFEITAIPTLVFFKDGRKVDQMVGVHSPEEIKAKLDSLA